MSTRTALITGASAGLGAEFARQLSEQGYELILVARRHERLASVAAQCGGSPLLVTADLSDSAAPQTIYDACHAAGKSVDVLINNAGIAGPNLLNDRDWQEQLAFYRLMMTSVAELCHLFIPDMRQRKYGRVVNVASVAGRIGRAGGCNYGPSKAYLIALSEELHLTVQCDGVHVTALCPGFTHTEFHETAGLGEAKANSPSWVWYTADVVVRDALNGVERGRSVVISGRLYRWLDPLLQSRLTRWLFLKPATRR